MTTKRIHTHADMDDTDPPATPTKKPKLEQTSTSTDVAMEDAQAELHTSADTQSAVPANHPQGGMLEAAQPIDQLNKEAACGITEFVSPDLLGFTGILKKRYAHMIFRDKI